MNKYIITLAPAGKFFFGGDMTFPLKRKEKNRKDDEFNEKYSSYIIRSNYLPQQTSLLGMLRFYLLSNNSTCFDKEEMKIKDSTEAAKLIGEHSFNLDKDDNYGVIESISPCFIQVCIDNGKWQTLIPSGFDYGITVKFNENCPAGTFNGRKIKIPELENFKYKEGIKRGFTTPDGNLFLSYDDIFEEDARIGINRDLSPRTGNQSPDMQDDAFYKQINYCFRKEMTEKVKTGNETKSIVKKLQFRFAFTATLKQKLDAETYSSALVSIGADSSTFALDISETDNTEEQKESGNNLKVTLLSDARIDEEALNKAVFSISETLPFRNIITNISTKDYGRFSEDKKRSDRKTVLYKRGSVFFFENECDKKSFMEELDKDVKFKKIGYNFYK